MSRKVAVLGMGRWGRTWCRVLDGEPGAEVAAVAVRPGTSAIELPNVHVFDDLAAALDVGGLDAAIVTLPVGLHLDAIRAAVARGIPVLCEKPAVATRAELAELEETGREATVLRASAARRPDTSYAGSTDLEAELLLDGGAEVAYDGTWAARDATTPWDGDWAFVGDRGILTVRDLAVDVDSGDGPRRVATTDPPDGDDDLAVAWREFARAIDGDAAAGVTADDNARSLALVFDLAEAAGIPDPSAVLNPQRWDGHRSHGADGAGTMSRLPCP